MNLIESSLVHEEVKLKKSQLKRQKTQEEKQHDIQVANANQVKVVQEIQSQVNALRRDKSSNVKSFFYYSLFSSDELGGQSRSPNPVADRQNVLLRLERDRERRQREAQGLAQEEDNDEEGEDD